MIRKVSHKEICREKYQKCILQSPNYRIYAEDWYLDIVSKNAWDCYVYGDYEAVMPVPYKTFLGTKIILQPTYCQQLGVFSPSGISEKLLIDFQNLLLKNSLLSYNFNEENSTLFSSDSRLKDRINYILSLGDSYETIFSNFNQLRRREFRAMEKLSPKISYEFDEKELIKELNQKYPHLQKYYNSLVFSNLLTKIKERKRYFFSKLIIDEKIISTMLMLKSGNRNILLCSSKNQDKRYKGAVSFLLNDFIKSHAETELLIDFEGSMLPNIALFNESFGAEKQIYKSFSFSKKDLIISKLRF